MKRHRSRYHPYRPKVNSNRYNAAGSTTVTYRTVHPTEYKYQVIVNLITNRSIVVDHIDEVHNEVLQREYYDKRLEKIRRFGNVEECLLFHGTKYDNIASICRYNFDWRLYGSNRGHKYGKGVCFSPNARYASNYSDSGHYKAMILANVLIVRSCEGHSGMRLPPPGHDTSHKGNGIVMVKYEDNEFYPAYVIYYHLCPPWDSGFDDQFRYNHRNYYNYNFN